MLQSATALDQKKGAQIPSPQPPMKSTPHGICMYMLPPHFNTALLNSTFSQPVPQPMDISPSGEPALQGMFDTNQFALERIFYDRMLVAAAELRPSSQCVIFYVPYFVSWETSSIGGTWLHANRPKLDKELFTHLTHFNSSGLPGRNHFIVVGRISKDAAHFINNGIFHHMVKLVLEETDPGSSSNVFAIPYPTWFRYSPLLEAAPGAVTAPPKIQIHSANFNMKPGVTGCDPNWLGDLTVRMRTSCEGRPFCSFLISPVEGHILPAGKAKCPIFDVSGQYSCGDGAMLSFKTLPEQEAMGHAVVLSCNRGPCWLWGACDHPGLKNAAGIKTRTGPLATIIGSARPKEYERHVLFNMCRERPTLCAVYETGNRENSSSFVHSRIPDMYQVLMASTFCINPPGDTPTRKGLFDSLVLGCIPVVTSEDSLQHYRFHLPFWRSVSVLVTTEQLFSEGFNLIDHLAEYETKKPLEVWQKQEAIRKAAYSLQYSLEPATAVMRGPDAFDKILEHMLSRPSSLQHQNDFPDSYYITSASGQRLFAQKGGDWGEGFGAGDPVDSLEQVWQVQGRGDGSCCYNIINLASHRTVYAQPNSTDTTLLGAAKTSNGHWADQKWRFASQGDGTFTIINVASGRRLFATKGPQGLKSFGATLANPGSLDQKWKFEKKR